VGVCFKCVIRWLDEGTAKLKAAIKANTP
jgi:hypothetical protein